MKPLAALLVAYQFSTSTQVTYDVAVTFDGFLPVLGGNEGVVDVKMAVAVRGAEPAQDRLRASSEITAFDLTFNGSKLPLTLDNVTEYFPLSNVELTPQGKITANDAPDRKLPVRLPGLDVKRFPDVTFVPLELPTGGLSHGKTWTFQREFGGAPLTYECQVDQLTDGTANIRVRVQQTYTVLENDSLEIVEERGDAVREVTTEMTGAGFVLFDIERGLPLKTEMQNNAVSQARDLEDNTVAERKLTTRFLVTARGLTDGRPADSSPARSEKPTRDGWLSQVTSLGRNLMVWVQVAAAFGIKELPQQLQSLLAPTRPTIQRLFPWLMTR